MKIKIPSNKEKIIELAQSIADQDAELGAGSPLASLNWGELLGDAGALKLAKEHHQAAKKLEKDVEKEYEDRDKFVAGLLKLVRRSRDILKGVHAEEPKKLGDFGFEVNHTA
ncbi:MAG: hypothetical protein ACI8UO_006100 [Verrucomicrobiales bacterium]|jgi:hypothetical protein